MIERRQPMRVAAFSGGLGDVILACHQTSIYERLEELSELCWIVAGSTNPFIFELFRWHPKRHLMAFADLSHKFQEFRAAGLGRHAAMRKAADFAGFGPFWHAGLRGNADPLRYHCVDAVLSEGHIVVQPFAGNRDRNFPEVLLCRLMEALGRIDRRVYIVTRDYIRQSHDGKKIVHDLEAEPKNLPDNVMHLRSLSVPATLKLVQDCALFIGGDSALTHAAWCDNKATLYMTRKPVPKIGQSYEWGTAKSNCCHKLFGEDFDLTEVLKRQLDLSAKTGNPLQ